MAAFDVEAFRPLAEFKKEVAEFAAYLKSCPPAAGFTEVFYPGELEHLRTQQKLQEGIFIEAATGIASNPWQRNTASRTHSVSDTWFIN